MPVCCCHNTCWKTRERTKLEGMADKLGLGSYLILFFLQYLYLTCARIYEIMRVLIYDGVNVAHFFGIEDFISCPTNTMSTSETVVDSEIEGYFPTKVSRTCSDDYRRSES
jgi:hypothetical protein